MAERKIGRRPYRSNKAPRASQPETNTNSDAYQEPNVLQPNLATEDEKAAVNAATPTVVDADARTVPVVAAPAASASETPRAPIHYSQSNNRFAKEEPADVNWNDYANKSHAELVSMANELKVEISPSMDGIDIAYAIMKQKVEAMGYVFALGILDILPDSFGFLRTRNYLPSSSDVYISANQIKRFNLNTGDKIAAQVRIPKEGERYYSVLRVESVNDYPTDMLTRRTHFNNLTPIYPNQKFKLEYSPNNITSRLIDLIAPIGKGQRGLIVSPPKAGKTTILKDIAHAITENNPEVLIKVLLVDERPEEVTDMQRSIRGEVLYSTFDEPPENHVKLAELVLQSAKRLVEMGKDVLILLDSITRLARAYNLVVPPSGRTLSGGLDPSSLHKPKRFFGGARNIEGGGSLTILATALVDTGSRMDDVIYEEFKGTGNMELHLDRKLANRRIFPAIDILASGTRKEDLLLDEKTLNKVTVLRRNIDSENAVEELIKLLRQSKTNAEFINSGIFG
jgi:transcription termination factor Rho